MKDAVWDSLISPNNLEVQISDGVNLDNQIYHIDIDSSETPKDLKEDNSIKSSDSYGGLQFPDFMGNSSGKKKKPNAKRLVKKTGGVNVKVVNVEDKGERFVSDFFTTLVDVRWRWTLAYFTISYVLSWFLFALIWWVIVRGHGDIDHFNEEEWKPCVVGVQSFSSIFLFSLETQHTIGYGYHRMSDECIEAIVLLVVQSIIGVLIESLTVGVFIVKLSRSKKRAQTVVFSKLAVICKKENSLALAFRVADLGKSMLLEAHIRAQLITKTVGKSEKVLLVQQAIELEADDQDEDRLFLFWPTTIFHEIDEDSPMYNMNPDNFKKNCDDRFEIVVVLEGIVESTGMTTQARTSYLPSEILWGQKFLHLLNEGVKYTANMELFHMTFPLTEMTAHSAKELREMIEEEDTGSETLEQHV